MYVPTGTNLPAKSLKVSTKGLGPLQLINLSATTSHWLSLK
jgi:hypothetical protein